ncbi:hypothetical protein BN59_03049 [Legionella massiliensis]|uniref:DUF4440 domain-containing protein n=1 Tax=Legionella massiliensis TaxID=1034943 RepID=A0A078L0P8_9GAMM|nr:hypothetical protein [Legionella massiliensis]CDZ78736.1 hypothetical protein BN59_03049 [Legionella massiliensis]CEE14474.1 hypothetical protein BN1094_03049 [Legionella massiliensis]
MKTQFKQAYDEVINLHIQIESLLGNSRIEEDRLPFLSHFHPEFTMIQPNGILRDFAWLSHWYQTAAGSRPQVKISIENFKNIYSCSDNVIVAYEEYQQVTTVESLRRSSTAIFVPTNNSKQPLLWRHLHETWVTT